MCDGSNCRNWVDNNTNRFTLLFKKKNFFTLDHLLCQVGVGTCTIVYSQIPNKQEQFLWTMLAEDCPSNKNNSISMFRNGVRLHSSDNAIELW